MATDFQRTSRFYWEIVRIYPDQETKQTCMVWQRSSTNINCIQGKGVWFV